MFDYPGRAATETPQRTRKGELYIMAKWTFTATDNGRKHQIFTVTAASKPEAIEKGFARAKKHAAGDLITWACKLKSV